MSAGMNVRRSNNYSPVRLRDLHLRVLAHRLKRRLYRVIHKSTKVRIIVKTMGARVRTEIEFVKTEEKPGGRKKVYTVLLDFPLDSSNSFSQMLRKTGALVYCSCEDFKFRLAYAMRVKNLLIAKRSALGRAFYEYPKITNPQLKVRACKHITMAVEALRGKTVTELTEPSAKGRELVLSQ